jgi:regulator of ribonuclease activity A
VKTTDICDAHEKLVQVADPVWRDFGGVVEFSGRAATLKVFEDNSLVRAALETAGNNRVLVVDGGGSLRCALLGGMLGELGLRNGWAGIVVFGCVRDSEELAACQLGIKALATHPRRSEKHNVGQSGIPVEFAGVSIREGDWLCADEDGLIVAEQPLSP